MDSRYHRSRHTGDIMKSPDLGTKKWFDRRLAIGNYSYSIKKIFGAVLVVIVFFVALLYLFGLYKTAHNDPDAAVKREIRSLTIKIGRSMELPQGEEPILAVVSDKSKLKGQDFFDHAKNGDRVLIYPKAKKAILYRPAEEKIIEVTNLTSGNNDNNSSQNPQ